MHHVYIFIQDSMIINLGIDVMFWVKCCEQWKAKANFENPFHHFFVGWFTMFTRLEPKVFTINYKWFPSKLSANQHTKFKEKHFWANFKNLCSILDIKTSVEHFFLQDARWDFMPMLVDTLHVGTTQVLTPHTAFWCA